MIKTANSYNKIQHKYKIELILKNLKSCPFQYSVAVFQDNRLHLHKLHAYRF